MVSTPATKLTADIVEGQFSQAQGAMRTRPHVWLIGLLFTVTACSVGRPTVPTHEAAMFRDEWIPTVWQDEISPLLPLGVVGADDAQGRSATAAAKANTARLTYHATIERRVTTLDGSVENRLPQVCVALSGGGIRASAVSLGVLRSLYAKGILSNTAYLSATSGGAYAAAWLYAASFIDQSGLDPLMLDASVDIPVVSRDPATGKFVRDKDQNLSGREGFLHVMRNRLYNRVIGHSDFVQGVGAAGVVTSPLLALYGLSRRAVGTSRLTPGGLGLLYSRAIRSTYLRDHEIQLSDVGHAQRAYGLPYPIFAGSIALGSRRPCGSTTFGTTFQDAVEITPDRLGNPHLGFTNTHRSLQLAELVAGVAAAPDNPKQELMCAVGDALGLDVGLRVNGLALVPSVVVPTATLAPGGTKPAHTVAPSQIADGVHVSDGGFTDNLALLPTVERMCSTTIVLDAEHDPRLEFESYKKFKAMLHRERGLNLSVPAIDAHLRYKAGQEDGSTIAYRDTRDLPYSADGLVRSYVRGDITGAVLYDEKAKLVVPVTLDIFYLKLGLDKGRLAEYDRMTRIQYSLDATEPELRQDGKALRCTNEGSLREHCPFPQESTFKQWFTVGEFMAYVMLGEHLARQLPEWK